MKKFWKQDKPFWTCVAIVIVPATVLAVIALTNIKPCGGYHGPVCDEHGQPIKSEAALIEHYARQAAERKWRAEQIRKRTAEIYEEMKYQ